MDVIQTTETKLGKQAVEYLQRIFMDAPVVKKCTIPMLVLSAKQEPILQLTSSEKIVDNGIFYLVILFIFLREKKMSFIH